jgi:hypothetical protein
MKILERIRLPRIPGEMDFRSPLRGPEVASRVGLWLGICFAIAFLTGLFSHFQQDRPDWLWLPARPVWIYQVTQGLHVVSGSAAVPLLLVKLWSVFPKLFARLPLPPLRSAVLHVAERVSIAALVGSSIFLLATGLANVTHWYPWAFSFRVTHYAVAWVAIGSLMLHVAVKLPVIRDALSRPIENVDTTSSGLTRRGVVRTALLSSGLVILTTAGSTVPWLRRASVFGVRSGQGPQGIPINKSAKSANVIPQALAPTYALTVVNGDRSIRLTRAELTALPQHDARLPIACVEGWSASGEWSGVRLGDLVAMVGWPGDTAVTVQSLQEAGPFIRSVLVPSLVADPLTLLALRLDGQDLSIDHGYPCRLIAPGRPGVLQTKWIAGIEVAA